MQKYKLIALDIDGTLVDDNKVISPDTINILNQLNSNNIQIVLSTGRPFIGLKSLLSKLNLTGPMITYNGGMIIDSTDGKVISENYLSLEAYLEIMGYAATHNITPMIWSYDKLYIIRENEFTKEYQKISNVKPIYITSYLALSHLKIHKILFYDLLDKIKEAKLNLSQSSLYDVFNSKIDFLEIVPKNVNKGNAIKVLQDYLNLPKEAIISIGDGENDVSMFHESGLSVSMKNASDAIKKESTITTLYTNNEDGVYHFLKSLFLI
ncbi:Cof-like hydrolase [Alteracholeplasma palmae J233]|uniref:Cof-like hydrolase n=1 Tax=Alteracholeplasma palmae (strain ATCC 49389 / J233) TaxID=1318466 RepID=U4KPE8_ALTPJ|nr:Cof-type HAD-IIB family hydrolase [Alteracholeplasma palmae]CCV64110.1 Cof-like hydrolase [Alteracholeplasma palmae J233]